MNQVSTVGLDLAKHIFQLHGADSAGAVVFRKKLRRGQLLAFLATLPPCTVALEACGSAHFWGREIARHAKENSVARRLMTIPGIGAVTAAALTALAPPAQTFRRGRDFAAWLGLTPVQRSSGGKERLGRTSKRGERSLRRLLIIGASAVARWAARKGVPTGSWLGRMLARKPPLLVRVALANKMARVVWALLAKGGVYRAPVVAAQR